MAIARVAINLKLFDILAKGNEKGFTTNELAEKTGVNYVLLSMLMIVQHIEKETQNGSDCD